MVELIFDVWKKNLIKRQLELTDVGDNVVENLQVYLNRDFRDFEGAIETL